MDTQGFPIQLVNEGVDWPAWIQAGGSIAAILAGFGLMWLQGHLHRRAAGRAASLLALNAVHRVTERVEAMLGHPSADMQFMLRGDRSREMVAVLREIEISTLPPGMIEPIARIRSALFALNSRIDEIYRTEERNPAKRTERVNRLKSTGQVLVDARREFKACFPGRHLEPMPKVISEYVLAIGVKPPLP